MADARDAARHGNWGKELPIVYRWAYDYSVPGAPQDFIAAERSLAAAPGAGPGMSVILVFLLVVLGFAGWWLVAPAADVEALARGRARIPSAGPGRPACRPQKIALGIFLAVVGALFALFASAYFMRMEFVDWRPMPVPRIVWLNTGMLVLGSIALQCALRGGTPARPRHAAAQPRHRRPSRRSPFSPASSSPGASSPAAGYLLTGNPANSFFYLLTGAARPAHPRRPRGARARRPARAWGAGDAEQAPAPASSSAPPTGISCLFVWLCLLVLFTGWATDFVNICRGS